MKVKTKNGFRVWHFIMFHTLCRQVGPYKMRPYSLKDWRSDSTLKVLFGC